VSSPLAEARTFLFVPGNRPERFAKAVGSGADTVVLDLEDAVPPGAKATARTAIEAAWPELHALGVPLVVRINSPEHAEGHADLEWLARLPGPAGVMVPKVEAAATLAPVRAMLPDVPILPLIESAAGWAALPQIASAQSVLRLIVGHIDFMADTGMQCARDQAELAPLRFAVAMWTRIHRLAPAVDGVTAAIHDDELLGEDTRRAVRYGFCAKLCIHPRQVPVVHAALAPAPDALNWAQRVVAADAAANGAAVQLDGRMVDAPVVLHARQLLARSRVRASAAS
jgi:citrate lyase subunit beta/citryl-CoA lyase